MTDEHDKKSSVDETSAPGNSEAPRRASSDVDPLAELIRMVKEEDPFADVLARKPGPLSGQRATPKTEGEPPASGASRAPVAPGAARESESHAGPATPPAAETPRREPQAPAARPMPRANPLFSRPRPAERQGASRAPQGGAESSATLRAAEPPKSVEPPASQPVASKPPAPAEGDRAGEASMPSPSGLSLGLRRGAVADDRSETPPKDDFKRPQMSVPDEKLEAQPKAPEPESPLRSGDPVIPDEPAMPPAAAAAEPAFDPEPSMDKAPSRLRSWLKPAQGGEQAASAPDAETPAAQAAGPAPEPEEVTAYEHDVPALDPVDLERALRDFRDVPEDVLRADAGWHNDAPDDEQDALDDHEEPVAPAAYSSAATGYTAAAYAAPSRGAPEASAEAAGGTRPDTYGEFDPVDPYDDPAFSDLDEDDYESDATAGESAYHEAPPEPYMSGDAIEEAVDERVDMGEAMAFQHAAANEEKPRRRGTFFAVGILLGLVILGGGFAYVMSGTAPQEEGEAPILRADTKPAKIEPEDPGGANIPNQDRLVFDRVSGEASGGKEQLVSREEEIIEPAGGQGEANSGMAQSGSGTSSSSGAASPSPGNSQAVLSPNGSSAGVPLAPVPRRVKTMVVRPDGSIVAAEPEPMRTASEPVATPAPAAPAPAPTSSEQMTASSESAQGEKTAERAVSALDNGASSSGAVPAPPSRPESTSESTSSGASTSSSVTPVRPVRGAPMPLNPNPVPRRTAEGGSSSTATPAPTPAPEASTSVSRQVASATPRSAPAPSSSGQYVVQLAARKNEEQAQGAYNALKAKYGSLLNRYQPLIQRADLGDRGVYYRVRVGPMATADAASELCNQLKAAGLADCLVRQR